MQRLVPFALLASIAVGCGQDASTNTATNTANATTITVVLRSGSAVTADVTTVPDVVAPTVECSGEKMTNHVTYEEGARGADSMKAAVDGWTFEGGAPYLRHDLRSVVDVRTGTANLVDETGLVRIVLSVRDNGNGWLVGSSERCVDR